MNAKRFFFARQIYLNRKMVVGMMIWEWKIQKAQINAQG